MKGWIAYGIAWLVAALLWTLASMNAGGDPLTMFPYAVLIMSTAAVMGVGVWNILMGSGLYLTVCSFSYAIRAQWRARAEEAAAADARLLAQQAQLTALR